VREVWHIVAQLTTYSEEIEETPRYPLETFLAGGGDCEDTAILLASMIRAAPVDWVVDLVYMDIDNPQDPQDVNHVMVHVDTGQRRYLIETVGDEEMEPFDDVIGWYLRVD
jgi:transglutaminase-like putative cysteine protease